MKKFLLVVLVGMVLTMDIYGLIKEIISFYEEQQVEEIDKSYTVVYME